MKKILKSSSIIIVFLICLDIVLLGYVFSYSTRSSNLSQSINLEQRAKEVFALKNNVPVDTIIIINKGIRIYKYIDKKSYDFKMSDNAHKFYDGVALDENGQEIDRETLVREDLAAQKAKFGKIEPRFAETLLTLPQDKPVEVNIVVNVPPHAPFSSPLDPNLTKEQYDEWDKKLLAYEDEYRKRDDLIVQKVVARVEDLGYRVNKYEYSTSFIAFLPPKFIYEIQGWEEIASIYGPTPNGAPS